MTRTPEFTFVGFADGSAQPALHLLFGPNEVISIPLDDKTALNLIQGLAHFLNETRKEKE